MEPDPTREWHYERDGSRVGPIAERRLFALIEGGDLRETTLVWTNGLADWTPFSRVAPGREPDLPETPEPESVDEPVVGGAIDSDPADPLVECAFSGEKRPRSKMLPFGDVWVAPEHRQDFVQQLGESGREQEVPLEGYPFPANLQFEPVFAQTLRVVGAQWKELILLCICVWAPVYLVVEGVLALITPEPADPEDFEAVVSGTYAEIWGGTFFNLAGELFAGAFVAAAVFQLTVDRWSGRGQRDTTQLFGIGLRCYGRVLLTRFLLYFILGLVGGILGWIGAMAGGVGGMIFFMLLILLLIVVLATRMISSEPLSLLIGRGGSAAIGTSWNVTQGHFWRVLGYRLLVMVPIAMVAGMFGILLEVPLPFFENFIPRAVISTLISIPTQFIYVFEAVLAIHLLEVFEAKQTEASGGALRRETGAGEGKAKSEDAAGGTGQESKANS